METLFLKLFNMSITAGWFILAVIVLRLLLHKAPKSMRCILWAMVGIRLLCPFSLESVFSLIPSPETIPQDIVYSNTPAIYSGIPVLNQSVNPMIAAAFTPNAAASANPLQIYLFIASIVWIIGMLAIAFYAFVSYLMLRRKVRESVRLDDHTWLCDHVPTPFIMGIFRPRIILPSAVSGQDLSYVLAHENTHLKRHDHWWKLLAFLLLTVYWFHPLIWIAYRMFSQDLELACDEKVIIEMGTESKKPYADALVNCSEQRHFHTAFPLAFCEISVAARIKAVLRYKKPAAWIVAAASVLCITSGFCFLTNPAGMPLRDTDSSGRPESIRLVSADRAYIITAKTAMEQALHFLGDVHTGQEIITADSNNDMDILDKTNQITIYYKNETEEYFFSRRCTQVWISDGSGSSLSKKVYNPKSVRHFFESRLDELADQSCSSSDASATQILYTYKSSPDFFDPCISLSLTDDTFSFTFSGFSSYLAHGTYTLTDQMLTLHTADGQFTYVFTVKQDAFVFDASRSSPIPKYRYSGISNKAETPVPDGAVFTSGSIYTDGQ